MASAYALLNRREEARAALKLWRRSRRALLTHPPSGIGVEAVTQLELSNIPESYEFPMKWSYEHRSVRERLFDGMHIAALPLETTVPSLVKTLKGDDPFARLSALTTLGRFGPMAKSAVPALIAALDDELVAVCERAVLALAQIGPAARDAIPALRALPEEAVISGHTKRAIKRITGD